MRELVIISLVLLASCGSPTPDAPAPTTFVTTIAPRQGSARRWTTAFGAAMPASNGVETLSIPQPGRIERLLLTPGSPVRAGQAILVFALAPSAQATFESAVSTLATAREQRATTARLLGQQLATKEQLAQADKALTDAKAALSAAQREGAGQAMQSVEAPFAGIVSTIPVAQGDRTQAGATLATVVRREGVVVTVGIDPASAGSIRAGSAARLHVLDGNHPIVGRVLRIDGQLNPTTRLIDVDLTIPAGSLLNGQAVKAEIESGLVQGWIVPHKAVVTDDSGAHVFQIAGGKAHAVSVQVLHTGADVDIVSGEIAIGRPIVVDGAYQVDDGGAVRSSG